jgi:cbb3-type cytochrome oxidase maturation protein
LLDPALRPPRPDATDRPDLARHIAARADGTHELTLAIDGLQCGACVWLIESVLAQEPTVLTGRVNMTTRRLRLVWRGAADEAGHLVGTIERLGYRLVPFDTAMLAAAQDRTGRALIRALAVAGFAAGNVMLISIGIWAGDRAGLLDDMGPATRSLLHWVSALIALPAIAYAGMPFFVSAAAALRHARTNMDVPISLGVLLVTGMSLAQTITGGEHTYFDSAVTLLFFLLIGRVLDHRARGQARATAEQLLTLRNTDVAVIGADGSVTRRPQHAVAAGDRVLVGMGERIGIDGVVETGESSLDASLVTGESLPVAARAGTRVFAGTMNLGAALTIRVAAAGEATLLADCVRLIEAAETRRGRFVVLADRVARRYAPMVHLTALATFAWWFFAMGVGATQALLTASAVLIVTCPCALALAVPAVQVIATSRLFRAGVLLKSATALERLAAVDTVVFDKTGTLTEPLLGLSSPVDRDALLLGASLATNSRHPLARALVAAAGPVTPTDGVTEHAGEGLAAGDVRLGSRAFCHVTQKEHDVAQEEQEEQSPPPTRGGGDGCLSPCPNLARTLADPPQLPPGPLRLRRSAPRRRRGHRDAPARPRPGRALAFRRPHRLGGTRGGHARHRYLAGRANAGAKGGRDRGPARRRPQRPDGGRRPERQPLARRRQRIGIPGERRRYQPDGRRRGVPGQAPGSGRAADHHRPTLPTRDAWQPGPGDRLQRPDGAAGGGRLRHALAGRRRDVEFVTAGDGEQLPLTQGKPAMTVILYLLAASLLLGGGGLALFLWSLRSGQYEDLDGAANRILFDDEE